MRRPLLLAAVLASVVVVPATAANGTRSWANDEIKLVVSKGLMGGKLASFRPDETITRGELAALVAGLTAKPAPAVAKPKAPVDVAGLDARLVYGLGLADAAARFLRAARAAGVAPPARFGTEVAARLLGLRKNHPAAQDGLERLATDPATRAEAAYSAAQILRFRGHEVRAVEDAAAAFALPQYSPWQKRVLATAFQLVGFPYVWGGTSDGQQAPFGTSATGGYDCSGFVWRVFKLQTYPGAPKLPTTLRGRTTFTMSAEMPAAKRIPFAKLAPADLVFIGKGPRSKPSEITHMGIYVGNGWMVHSSRHGVTLDPMTGWYRAGFAWGRRPLAEAGLASYS